MSARAAEWQPVDPRILACSNSPIIEEEEHGVQAVKPADNWEPRPDLRQQRGRAHAPLRGRGLGCPPRRPRAVALLRLRQTPVMDIWDHGAKEHSREAMVFGKECGALGRVGMVWSGGCTSNCHWQRIAVLLPQRALALKVAYVEVEQTGHEIDLRHRARTHHTCGAGRGLEHTPPASNITSNACVTSFVRTSGASSRARRPPIP